MSTTDSAPTVPRVQQGHLYQHGDSRVLAMSTGPVVRCRKVLGDTPPWMGPPYLARAEWLQPLPMKYFRNEVPRA